MRALRETILVVDLDKLASNTQIIKSYLQKNTKMLAVVKANGYNHGAVNIAETLAENGVEIFGVATLNEAVELRKHGVQLPILIMGNTSVDYLDYVCEYNLTMAIVSKEHADKVRAYAKQNNKTIFVHLAVDSGMRRIGFTCDEQGIKEVLEVMAYPELKIDGIFTHFSQTEEEADREQFSRFSLITSAIEKSGFAMPMRHVCSSQPIALLPEYHLDLVRAGTILYGTRSFQNLKLNPIASWHSKIISLRTIEENTPVSYGYKWTSKRKTVVATLPFGFSDGFSAQLFGIGYVVINGKRAPMIGKVCMDQCMVDVTDIEDVKVNDDVLIFGDGSSGEHTVEQLSEIMGVTRGEVLSRISARVPRVYKKDGEVVWVRDLV